MNNEIDWANMPVEQINAHVALFKAITEKQKADIAEAKLQFPGKKVVIAINNYLVYAAGSCVAVLIGLGAISGIIWLAVQVKHLIGG